MRMFVGPDVNWDVVHVCQGCSHSATHNPILCQNPEFAISQTGSPQLHLDSDNPHEKIQMCKIYYGIILLFQSLRVKTKVKHHNIG